MIYSYLSSIYFSVWYYVLLLFSFFSVCCQHVLKIKQLNIEKKKEKKMGEIVLAE